MTTTDDLVRKAKEEAERTILIFNRKDSDSWLPLTTDKAVFCFYTDFLRIKNITKDLIKEVNRQAEEIKRLNDSLNEKYPLSSAIKGSVENVMKEMRDRIADLEQQLKTSLANQNKNMQRQINEERNKNKKLEKENQELKDIAELIHYPSCWDCVVYPTLLDAIKEISSDCTNEDCKSLRESGEKR